MKNQKSSFIKKNPATSVVIGKSMRNDFNNFTLLKLSWFLFLIVLTFFAANSKAQNVSTYCFSQTSGTYSTPTGAINMTLAGGNTDDGYSSLEPIGFNFTYAGNVFTQFSANTNGYIVLGALASSTTVYVPLYSLTNCISFCGGNGKVASYPSYVTSGTAPNRVLTVQFSDYYVDYLNTTNVLYVELLLYETTNAIQIVYGSSTHTNDVGRQVGLTGTTVADFNDRKSTTSWSATNAGTLNTDTLTWSSTVYPANGQTYTWTPPVVIISQPSTSSQNLCPNAVATAISITSTATLYQWYSNTVASNTGGTLISGATSSSYTPLTTTNGTLYYYCVVSNSCGSSINSNVSGAIIVGNPPNPTSVNATPFTICNGSSTSLSATSTGYSIDWYTAASGGTSLGTSTSGGNYIVSPTVTTTYYAESEGNNFTSTTFSYTGSIVTWTVPTGVTSLTITAAGAQGGQYSATNPGGLGATVQGTFSVTGGQVLSILVGQQPGGTACSCMPGGGGGTFVALGASYTTATPMICAGGGGGSYSGGAGQGGQITNVTTSGDGGGPVPGTNGNGAASTSCGGGGGGFYTSGGNDTYYPTYGVGGAGFRQGGAGGVSLSYGPGGFGGGATADFDGSCYTEGGAGGGYSGGSGYNSTGTLLSGYGGGSYNSGTSQTNTAGANSGNGSVIISYFTPSCASPSRVPVTVTVIPGPVFSVQPSTATQTLCFNGTSTPLTVAAAPATSYQWYSNTTASNSGGTLIGGANSTTYSPLTTTAGTLYYYCVATSGCSFPSNVSGAITVYPVNGIPTISGGITSICSGNSPGTLTATGTGGDGTYTYLWYIGGVSSGITTQTYNPGSLTTDTSIYCAVTSCGLTQNSLPFNVSVISAPPTVTATPPTVCPGSSTSLSATYPGFNINWYTTPSGGTAIGSTASGGNLVVSPTTATTYYAEAELGGSGSTTIPYSGAITTWTVPVGITSITITAAGAQGSSYSATYPGGLGAVVTGTFTVTPGQVLSILAGQQFCSACSTYAGGGGGTFVANGASYTTATPMIVAGGGGGCYSGGTAQGGQITNITTTGDGGGPVPGTNGNGAGATTCGGGGGGFYTSGAADVTFGSTYGPGGTGFWQGGAAVTGMYGTGGFGGGAPADYYSTCNTEAGAGGGYSGASGYNSTSGWYSGYGGGSYNSGTSQINTAATNSGNGYVSITWTVFSCSSATRTSVVVNMATPAAFTTQPSATAQHICLNGTSTALTVAAAPVTGYQWYSNTAASNTGGTQIGGATGTSYTPLTTTAGTLYYYCDAIDSGCSIPSNVSGAVVVYPIPTVNAIANQTYCSGATVPATALSGPVSGSTFAWTNSNTAIGLAASGAGAVTSFVATNATSSPITATITVTPHANGCTGTPLTYTITINPSPTVSITGTTTICKGSSTTLTASANTTYAWSSTSTTQSINVAPTISTTYTVTVTNTYTCTATASALVTVNTVTVGIHPSPDTVCTGASSTITASGGTTYNWSSPPGGTTSSVVVSPTTATAYTVTVTASNGCTATAVTTIYVKTCTGISEINPDNNFELYPNPADNSITIENTSSNKIKNAVLSIYNIEGQLLLTQPMLQSKMNIDIMQLARGMYYVELKSETGKAIKKFVKD